MFFIQNEDGKIKDTNFWETPLNKFGLFFISNNANTSRLLIPQNQETLLYDIVDVQYCILSIGSWKGRKNSLELLFEDFTDSPYSIHVGPNQTDLLPDAEKTDLTLLLYTNGLKLSGKYPLKLRFVDTLPYLKEWK